MYKLQRVKSFNGKIYDKHTDINLSVCNKSFTLSDREFEMIMNLEHEYHYAMIDSCNFVIIDRHPDMLSFISNADFVADYESSLDEKFLVMYLYKWWSDE